MPHTGVLEAYSQVVAKGPDVGCEAYFAACHGAAPHKADATGVHCFFNVKVPRPFFTVGGLGKLDESAATG
jgi:hypothetical protein